MVSSIVASRRRRVRFEFCYLRHRGFGRGVEAPTSLTTPGFFLRWSDGLVSFSFSGRIATRTWHVRSRSCAGRSGRVFRRTGPWPSAHVRRSCRLLSSAKQRLVWRSRRCVCPRTFWTSTSRFPWVVVPFPTEGRTRKTSGSIGCETEDVRERTDIPGLSNQTNADWSREIASVAPPEDGVRKDEKRGRNREEGDEAERAVAPPGCSCTPPRPCRRPRARHPRATRARASHRRRRGGEGKPQEDRGNARGRPRSRARQAAAMRIRCNHLLSATRRL